LRLATGVTALFARGALHKGERVDHIVTARAAF